MDKYLIIVGTQHALSLFDPSNEKIMQKNVNLGLLNDQIYYNYARYSFSFFNNLCNLGIFCPQNTTYVHNFELFYNSEKKNSKFNKLI